MGKFDIDAHEFIIPKKEMSSIADMQTKWEKSEVCTCQQYLANELS